MTSKNNPQITQLSALAEKLVSVDAVIDLCGVPYDPEKCSAKSAAAILGLAIPQLSKELGIPVTHIGGVPCMWSDTHFEPITAREKQSILQAFAKPCGLLKPSILTSDFQREFDRSFANHGHSDILYDNEPRRGINFLDGLVTFNVDGAQFHAGHDPRDLCTYCIPGWFKKKSNSPAWQKFIGEVLPDPDIRRYVLGMLANSIAGDPLNVQKILLLVGAAGAGKSTLIEAVAGCIGPGNVMRTDNLAQLTRDDSRHRMRLAQATLCISADASDNLGDKDTLKMIVSKEPIIARKLYQEPIEVKPRASLIVASNEMGFTYSLSDPGVARRFDIITFNNAKAADKMDGQLHLKLATEDSRATIAQELCDALDLSLKEQGRLLRPAVLQEQLDRLKAEGDPFSAWMQSSGISTEKHGSGTVEVHQDEAYNSFRMYCVENGYNNWSVRKFKARLRSLNLLETGKRGGKHSYEFFLVDMQLCRSAQLINPFHAG